MQPLSFTRPALAVVCLVSLGSTACGGAEASSGSAAAPPRATTNKAAAQCLETAGAKRERRRNEPAKITVKHILVKYAGAKNAPASVTRSREDACLRALEARGTLQQGGDFDGLVQDYSDEPGAASRAGKIADITRTDVVRPFADAAFELDVNQVSNVVETEFGFHVILRTE